MENVLSSIVPGYDWGRDIFRLPTNAEIAAGVVTRVNVLNNQVSFSQNKLKNYILELGNYDDPNITYCNK